MIESTSLKTFHQTVKKLLNTRCSLKSLDVTEVSVSRSLACLCLLSVCWDNTHISYILHFSFVLHSVLLLRVEADNMASTWFEISYLCRVQTPDSDHDQSITNDALDCLAMVLGFLLIVTLCSLLF